MADLVTLSVEDGVGIIQLDRPPMNAINVELTRDLVAVTTEVTSRDDVGAVVLWGGEKVFAAGADVKMMSGQSPLEIDAMITGLQDAFNLFEEIPKVTIAAITGVALGGGLELAMCADFRFAAQDSRLGQPEIKLGVIPGAGGTQRLPRLVGPARAKDIIYSGRFVGADEALRIGLVDAVSPTEEVFPKAVEAARSYARGPRAALRSAKVAVNWGARGDLRTGLVLERELFAGLFASDDQTEGMNAFIEKRDAVFTGR
jgi:enoyl-CoA hydratase/carnithine racemase